MTRRKLHTEKRVSGVQPHVSRAGNVPHGMPPTADLRRGRCPRCEQGLGPLLGPLQPGWFRCLHCHIDVHPEQGLTAEDPIALVLEGFTVDRSEHRGVW